VWFDIVTDPRTGKQRAENVSGAGVFALGGRALGVRNARAFVLEAMGSLPRSAEEPAASLVVDVLAAEMERATLQGAARIVGDTARQGEGECLHFAALTSVRLITRLGPAAVAEAAWWPTLRKGLLALADGVAAARPPRGARKAGAGGTPGADNGLRYALQWALEALARAGALGNEALAEAVAKLPAEASCAPTVKGLLYRRCHLTNCDHTF